MAEEKDLKQAKVVFDSVCQMLDGEGWKYDRNDAELRIDTGVKSDDLPIKLIIRVDAERQLVTLLSHIPFAVAEDKLVELAIAVSVVNNRLVDGCFDYNILSGDIFFRITNTYRESILGEDMFRYMLYAACNMIDEYNDKFLMIAKGVISLEQFIQEQNA